MNGKCSDENDSHEDGGGNLIARHQPHSAEYSVRPLPETPCLQNRQLVVQTDPPPVSFVEPVGNSVTQELRQDYLVTSTRSSIDQKTGINVVGVASLVSMGWSTIDLGFNCTWSSNISVIHEEP